MTLKEYKAELTGIFRRNSTRGFADWRQCGNLAHYVEKLLEEAESELLQVNRDKELFDLVCAAFLKWGKLNKDDSNGETQSFVYYYAFKIWNKIYERERSEIPHAKMMDWFLKNLNGSVVDYMEDLLLEFLMSHFKEPELLDRKLNFLNERIIEKEKLAGEKSWNVYEIDRCRNYILQIYWEQRRPIEEIRAYAQNLNRNDSRELLAKIELDYGNRDQCIAIYKALADSAGNWDLGDYNSKLKELYKRFGMQEEYAAQVKKLIHVKVGEMEIWEEYKALIPEEDWIEHVNQLFTTFSSNDHRLLTWYDAEGRYDLLMDGVEYEGVSALEYYEGKLAPRYTDRCLNILVEAANDAAEYGNNRSDYRHIAKYLKWMRKYPGGSEKAAELADNYRKCYPRRTAMIDELRGI